MAYETPATPALLELLDRAVTPCTARELGVDATTLGMLLRSYLLVRADEAELLAGGVLRMPARPIAQPRSLATVTASAEAGPARIAFLGAPCDAGGGLGARRGPDLVRRGFATPLHEVPGTVLLDYELRREVDLTELEAWDLGDVVCNPDDGLDRFGRRLRHAVHRLLDAAVRPLVIGGDHAISAYVLDAMLDAFPGLHVVQLDAHPDLRPIPSHPPRLTHATVMTHVLADPRLGSLLQLGLRVVEPRSAPRRPEPRLRYYSARELARTDPAAVVASIPAGAPCYLSIDVDVLSPFEAAETATPEIGGLTYYQTVELIAALTARVDLVGADIVEVAGIPGALTGSTRTALLAARLLLQIALGFAGTRPLADHAPP